MSKIQLTENVRNLLSAEGAEGIQTALAVITHDVDIKGKPPVHWWLDQKRNTLRCFLNVFPESLDEGPVLAALVIYLPDNAIIQTGIPDEHCWLTLKDNRLWTAGDLSMVNEDTFYSLELILSMTAYQRVAARLQIENPHAWRTWQRWPDREIPAA